MKYCKRCFYPDTKPDLVFNAEGICSACTASDARASINWDERESLFRKHVDQMKAMSCGRKYDCIVPVSGGKDSTYQVIKCLEYGLNVLAVTATTCDLTPLGRKNLDNIGKLGVDHIEVTPNRQVRKRLNKYCLETIGDISWPEHITIFSIPFRVAMEKNIGAIMWGENPQNEYGGPLERQGIVNLDQRWLSEFGGLNGLRVKDLVSKKLITEQESEIYRFPAYPDTDIKGLFLGNYFEWDGIKNAEIALEHGFQINNGEVEGSGFAYENLDNYQTGIHDYFKYLKFGFGRATDICNNWIRRGKMTRARAKEHIIKWDGKYYNANRDAFCYLGKSFISILEDIGMDIGEFTRICEEFRNKELFDESGNFKYTQVLKDA